MKAAECYIIRKLFHNILRSIESREMEFAGRTVVRFWLL